MSKVDEQGNYLTISEVRQRAKQEQATQQESKPPLPAKDPQPLAQTDPGPDPGQDIDEFVVEQIGPGQTTVAKSVVVLDSRKTETRMGRSGR